MSDHNGFAWLRVVTPILVTVSLFILSQIWTQVNELNQKMYHHATNESIHIPKSELVSLQIQIAEMRKEIIATIRGTK